MGAESTAYVMVLAVHVIGDGAGRGDEARARCHRQEVTVRKRLLENVTQQHAGSAGQFARLFVTSKNSIEAAAVDQRAAIIVTAVAIRTDRCRKEASCRLRTLRRADALQVLPGGPPGRCGPSCRNS